ncbi:hypothetical protein Patl1_37533 [Pistacia atlantica]|nr:hypothetical protein Patl1_37533 [Pistacia atlantica]
MEEAVCALEEMKHNGIKPSLKIYNSIIHGYSKSSKFEDALLFLYEMKGIGLKPKTNTYDGLIQSYGKYKIYSKIDCIKVQGQKIYLVKVRVYIYVVF